MRICVINGPNLNWLGRRQPEIYGELGLEGINLTLSEYANELNVELDFFQSNSEGEIIDALQMAGDKCAGVIINPGAYGHYSLAIADAIAGLSIPVVEVHLTNVFSREEFRHRHVTAGNCLGYICGFGWRGYKAALEILADNIKEGE